MKKQNEVDIDRLAYGGMGVARLDGKVCFIEGALPGEKVSFIKDVEKKRFIAGRAVEIITASKHRVQPPCPYYGKCGGCQYQHLAYEEEVSSKAQQVKELLSRIGGLKEYSFEGITPSPLNYEYRSSITVHRSESGYGYFSMDNKTIIDIEKCALAIKPINDAIGTLTGSDKKQDITLKYGASGEVWISGRSGHRFFKNDFLGTELTFSPLAFSQVNQQVAVSMVETLRTWMQEEKSEVLFDLYCGVGFFGLLMRDMFDLVVGIDANSVAIDCAQTTKKALNIKNVKFYCEESNKSFPHYYEKLRGNTNTIILDPPRSGISKDLVEWLRRLKGTNCLYYISCDPAILARDAKLFTQDGAWTLDKVVCFDMFPRTKYVESIALFQR